WNDGEPGDPKGGRVTIRVADVAHLVQRDAGAVGQHAQRMRLVFGAVDDEVDLETARQDAHHRRLLARDEPNLHTVLPCLKDGVDVAIGELLPLTPDLVHADAAVGQDAVHVERQQADRHDVTAHWPGPAPAPGEPRGAACRAPRSGPPPARWK